MTPVRHVREILIGSHVYLCAMLGAILYSAIATTPTDYLIVLLAVISVVLTTLVLSIVLCALTQSSSDSVVAMESTWDRASSSSSLPSPMTNGTASLI